MINDCTNYNQFVIDDCANYNQFHNKYTNESECLYMFLLYKNTITLCLRSLVLDVNHSHNPQTHAKPGMARFLALQWRKTLTQIMKIRLRTPPILHCAIGQKNTHKLSKYLCHHSTRLVLSKEMERTTLTPSTNTFLPSMLLIETRIAHRRSSQAIDRLFNDSLFYLYTLFYIILICFLLFYTLIVYFT